MSTNLILAKVTVPNTSASRTFGAHLSCSIDVRDFGALGDGVTDDTAAIQAAVNYAVNNGLLLLFPQANPSQFYNISSRILIPPYKRDWAIRGTSHRVNIKQLTDNTPFLHMDSLGTSGSGFTNGGFDISNFQVTWTNNQIIANTHAAVVEFNDGIYADFVLDNLSNVNGCRCITTQSPGQTAARPLNVGGCLLHHLYNQTSASGAAVYLKSNPVENLPNINIQHVFSAQTGASEELIHLAGATSVEIENVEQNFGLFTPGFVGELGAGNIKISGWRLESYGWFNGGTAFGYFSLNGSGTQISEYDISGFEMRGNTINLSAGDKYIVQVNGARVKFDGFLDTGTIITAGNVNIVQLLNANDIVEIGISTILSPAIQFCKPNDNFISQIQFSGGTQTMQFYKNALTNGMVSVINDDASSIKGQVVAQNGWIWSISLYLDNIITGGSVQAAVFKNNAVLDANTSAVSISGGRLGQHFNQLLKNQSALAYSVVSGDVIDVRTTAGSGSGTVVFDAQSSVDITANGAVSFSNSTTLTVGTGTNRALLVGVSWSGGAQPAGVSITWGGVALTLISGTSIGFGTPGANTAIYGLLNPASGTLALAGSWTGARDFCVGAVSYTGVSQTSFATSFTGYGVNGTSGNNSVTVTSAVGDACFACFANDASAYTALTGTTVYNDGNPTLISAAACRDTGAASVTLTATTSGGANNWGASGIDIKAAAAATLVGPTALKAAIVIANI